MRGARVALGQGYVTVGQDIRRVIINTFAFGFGVRNVRLAIHVCANVLHNGRQKMIIAITKHYCYRHNYGYCYYDYCDYDYHSIVKRKDAETGCTDRKICLQRYYRHISVYLKKVHIIYRIYTT